MPILGLLVVTHLLLLVFFLSLPRASHAIRCIVACVVTIGLAIGLAMDHCREVRRVAIGLAIEVSLKSGRGVVWVVSRGLNIVRRTGFACSGIYIIGRGLAIALSLAADLCIF